MNRFRARTLAFALLPAVSAVIVGCGSDESRPKSIAVSTYAGVASNAPSASAGPIQSVVAGWSGRRLELTTFGSGSCPAVPVALKAVDANTVEVTISGDYTGSCSTDISPTTSVVDLPDTITAQTELNVRIHGALQADLRVPRA
jgi:hypothetical protein